MFELLDGILNVIGWMLNHIMGTMFIGLGVVFLYLAVVAGGGFWLVAAGLVLIGLGIYFWL